MKPFNELIFWPIFFGYVVICGLFILVANIIAASKTVFSCHNLLIIGLWTYVVVTVSLMIYLVFEWIFSESYLDVTAKYLARSLCFCALWPVISVVFVCVMVTEHSVDFACRVTHIIWARTSWYRIKQKEYDKSIHS